MKDYLLSSKTTKGVTTKVSCIIPADGFRNIYIQSKVSQKVPFLKVFSRNLVTEVKSMELYPWWFDLVRKITYEGFNIEGYAEHKLKEVDKDYRQILYNLDKEGIVIDPDLMGSLKRQQEELLRCLHPINDMEKRLLKPILDSGFHFIGRYTAPSQISRAVTLLKEIVTESTKYYVFIEVAIVGLGDRALISAASSIVLDEEVMINLASTIAKAYKKEEM